MALVKRHSIKHKGWISVFVIINRTCRDVSCLEWNIGHDLWNMMESGAIIFHIHKMLTSREMNGRNGIWNMNRNIRERSDGSVDRDEVIG